MKIEEYLNKVTEQIRCKKAHESVEGELKNHILDQMEAYKLGGMDEEEALDKAIIEMGDPVATEKPAQAPPVIEYLSQARCFLPKENTPPRPIATPICTEGPSFPSGNPRKKEVSDMVKIPNRFRTKVIT